MISTDEGRQIDESNEHSSNIEGSRRESLDPDSNMTLERDVHFKKQHCLSVVTDEGMQIEESDEQWLNADASMHET
jgi:hypothetical protein